MWAALSEHVPWVLGSLQEAVTEPEEGLLARGIHFAQEQAWGWMKDNPSLVFLALWGAARSIGKTVETGTTGLFFNLGRATRVLEPGFYFKIPYFQAIKILPTRSRTMDVPNQKVTSLDGLVWFVDVNLVYRITDIRKGLIEVDDLVKAMEQILGLSVQDIVRNNTRAAMRLSGGLDELLAASMGERLEAWGVELESVGFTSIRPSPKTLLFTQQKHSTEERERTLLKLEGGGIARGHALAMLGAAPKPERRARRAAARESHSRRRRRILRAVRRTELESTARPSPIWRAKIRRATVAHLAQGS